MDTSIIGIDQQVLGPLFLSDCTAKGSLVKDVYAYMGEKPDPNPPSYCDPVSVLVLFRSDLVLAGMNVRMLVQTRGKRTRGTTILDYFGPESHKTNVYLIIDLDTKVILEETMQSY